MVGFGQLLQEKCVSGFVQVFAIFLSSITKVMMQAYDHSLKTFFLSEY